MSTIYAHLGDWTGLGNQMFQYATLKIKSLSNKCELVIQPGKQYMLNMFESIRDHQKLITELPQGLEVTKEKWLMYDEVFDEMKIEKSIIAQGYFQSKKYFDIYRAFIRDSLFKFSEETTRECEKWRAGHKKRLICVHIRLPNIKNENPLTVSYSIPTREYIKEAFKQFDRDDRFVVFSNNVEWVKELFGKTLANYDHEFSEGNEEQDMAKMTLCDGYILTSSTFSWWGVYLNKNENAKVVSCTPFFNPIAHSAHLNELFDGKYYEKNWKLFNLLKSEWTN